MSQDIDEIIEEQADAIIAVMHLAQENRGRTDDRCCSDRPALP